MNPNYFIPNSHIEPSNTLKITECSTVAQKKFTKPGRAFQDVLSDIL